MEILLIIIISYLLGSIPFGFLLTKIFLKKDIRNIGSGNIGATNALRTGNKTLGYFTLILDISKAIIPILIMVCPLICENLTPIFQTLTLIKSII